MKIRKSLCLLLALVMMIGLVACGGEADKSGSDAASKVKIGVILVGDETEGYTAAHMEGIKKAAAELGRGEGSFSLSVCWQLCGFL